MPAEYTLADQLRLSYSGTVWQLVTAGGLPGTEIEGAAARNGLGAGQLKIDADGLLYWKAPGSSQFGHGQAASTGKWILCDGEDVDKYILIEVWSDYLPDSPQVVDVRLDARFGGIGDDIAAADIDGLDDMETYTLRLDNMGSEPVNRIRAWLGGLAVAGYVGLFNWIVKRPAAGDGAVLSISDDNVTFVTPNKEADALLLGDLAAGGYVNFYLKRFVPDGTLYKHKVEIDLRISFDGI